MERNNNGCKVCVTGGSGNIASWLINKLLHKRYTVHATLRNLDDVSKISVLKSFPGAESRLVLFKADIYKPYEFEDAIKGCQYVFHVATPLLHTEESQYKNTSEATVAAAKSIVTCCIRSGTVKRVIYTATVIAASPLKEDGSGFKDLMDETSWSSFDLSIPYSTDFLKDIFTKGKIERKFKISDEIQDLLYTKVKVKDLLCLPMFQDTSGEGNIKLGEQKWQPIGGGNTCMCALLEGIYKLLPSTPVSVAMFYSHLKNNLIHYNTLKYIEELLGKLPIVHIDDVCEAHIFCMENPSIRGRFLCASSYISSAEISGYYQQYYAQFHVKKEYLEGPKRIIELDSSKLIKKGFVYRYDTKMILDDCISCAKRMDDL